MTRYSDDLRVRIVAARESGSTHREIAEQFSVSCSLVRRLVAQVRDSGSLEPAKPRSGRPRKLTGCESALREAIALRCDTTLAELRAAPNLDASLSTIHETLKRMGLTLKKKQIEAEERKRPDVAIAREEWAEWMVDLDAEHLVFLDETWATNDTTRRYGRAMRGERAIDGVPHSHYHTTTLLASLRIDGMGPAMILDGAMTGDYFLAYIKSLLIPSLRPGDIVIVDNSACHTGSTGELVRKALEAVGCFAVWLPAYSPDYNPIEKAFSKLKSWLRKERIRSIVEVEKFFGKALDEFPPEHCRNFFGSCGYGAT